MNDIHENKSDRAFQVNWCHIERRRASRTCKTLDGPPESSKDQSILKFQTLPYWNVQRQNLHVHCKYCPSKNTLGEPRESKWCNTIQEWTKLWKFFLEKGKFLFHQGRVSGNRQQWYPTKNYRKSHWIQIFDEIERYNNPTRRNLKFDSTVYNVSINKVYMTVTNENKNKT